MAVEHIALNVHLPEGISEQRRASILRAVEHCTVRESLRYPADITVAFNSKVQAPAMRD